MRLPGYHFVARNIGLNVYVLNLLGVSLDVVVLNSDSRWSFVSFFARIFQNQLRKSVICNL